MTDNNFFRLLFNDLEERPTDNVAGKLKQDKLIEKRLEAIQEENTAYSMVLFRLGMQYCFSLLMHLQGTK